MAFFCKEVTDTTYTHTHTHIYIYIYVCVCVCACVCVCVCVYSDNYPRWPGHAYVGEIQKMNRPPWIIPGNNYISTTNIKTQIDDTLKNSKYILFGDI